MTHGWSLRLLTAIAAAVTMPTYSGWLGNAGATRYGEASHLGPRGANCADEQADAWETYGSARFRRPHRPGFHQA